MFRRLKSFIESRIHRSTSTDDTISINSAEEAEELAREVAEQLRQLYDEGSGTPQDPYQIRNEEQLRGISLAPEAHYQLTASFAVNGLLPTIERFSGTLNGCENTIEGLSAKTGWIACNEGGLINLILENPSVHGAEDALRVGLVCENHGVIQNIQVRQGSFGSAAVEPRSYLGFIAGANLGHISHCRVSGRASSIGARVGGVVGTNSGSGRVVRCETVSLLTELETERGDSMGGIAATNHGVLRDCSSRASLWMNTEGMADIGGVVSYQGIGGVALGCHGAAEMGFATRSRKAIGGVCGINHGELADCASDDPPPRSRRRPIGVLAGALSPRGSIRFGTFSHPMIERLQEKLGSREEVEKALVGRETETTETEEACADPETPIFEGGNVVSLFH